MILFGKKRLFSSQNFPTFLTPFDIFPETSAVLGLNCLVRLFNIDNPRVGRYRLTLGFQYPWWYQFSRGGNCFSQSIFSNICISLKALLGSSFADLNVHVGKFGLFFFWKKTYIKVFASFEGSEVVLFGCRSGIFLWVQFQKIGNFWRVGATHARQSFHF